MEVLSGLVKHILPLLALAYLCNAQRGASNPGGLDYVRTYDGVLDSANIASRVFRLQEGAIVKVICSLKAIASIRATDSEADMYVELGGVRIGKKDEPWAIDGVELTEFLQNYQSDGNSFTNVLKRRFLVMTYTARMEDDGKELLCTISDEDSTSSSSVASSYTAWSNSRAGISLLVLPAPSPVKLTSTIGDHVWPGGFTGEISVSITDFFNSWKIILKFPKPVYRIYANNFNIARENCLHQESCPTNKRTWIIYNTYENRVLSPAVSPLKLQFAADCSKRLGNGRGKGLVAKVKFYGYNKVFTSDYEPSIET